MGSAKAVGYQAAELCNALENLLKILIMLKKENSVQSLISQMMNYPLYSLSSFLSSLLYQVNYVNKELQNDTTDIATKLFYSKNFVKVLVSPSKLQVKTTQDNSFDEGLIDTRKLAKDLGVEPIYKIRSKCLPKNYLVINLYMNFWRKQLVECNA